MSDELTLLVVIGDTIASPAPLTAKGDVGAPIRGSTYEGRVLAEGGEAPYTYAVVGGSLPAGTSLDTSTGQITGTPTTQGWSEFSIQITDANSNVETIIVSMTVTGGLGWKTREIPPAQHAIPYATKFSPEGGTPPYTLSLIDGSLSGTLTLSGANVGDYTIPSPSAAVATQRSLFTLRVTDSTGNFSDREFTQYILPPLQVTGTAFAYGLVGLYYESSLGFRYGIVQPYPSIDPVRQWTVTAGSLPDGLTLDPNTGRLFGTPELAGSFSVTIELTDSTGAVVSTPATVEIFDVGAGGGGGETSIDCSFGDGVNVIQSGSECRGVLPFDIELTEWSILAQQSGSISFYVYADASAPPTSGDSITASAPPLITGAQEGSNSALTGWTTTLAAGTRVVVGVTSCSGIKQCALNLKGTR